MFDRIRRLVDHRDEDGASSVEYGLLIAGIAAFIIVIVFLLGGVVTEAFTDTCDSVKDAASLSAACS
jgi:pilus assembly protein Flp/PilA